MEDKINLIKKILYITKSNSLPVYSLFNKKEVKQLKENGYEIVKYNDLNDNWNSFIFDYINGNTLCLKLGITIDDIKDFDYEIISNYYLNFVDSEFNMSLNYNLILMDKEYYFIIANKQRLYNKYPILLKIDEVLYNDKIRILKVDNNIELLKRKIKIESIRKRKS